MMLACAMVSAFVDLWVDIFCYIAFVPQTDRGVVINDACLGHIVSAFVDLCVDIYFLHTNNCQKRKVCVDK